VVYNSVPNCHLLGNTPKDMKNGIRDFLAEILMIKISARKSRLLVLMIKMVSGFKMVVGFND